VTLLTAGGFAAQNTVRGKGWLLLDTHRLLVHLECKERRSNCRIANGNLVSAVGIEPTTY
jgi:hypothetical protein